MESCPVLDLENADFNDFLNGKTGHRAFIMEIYAQSLDIDDATSTRRFDDYLSVERAKALGVESQRFLVNPICCPHMPLRAG